MLSSYQGISASGSGLGGLVFSNVTRVTLERLGVKWALIINGLISLAILIPAVTLIKGRHKALKVKSLSFELKWFVHPGFVWILLWASCCSESCICNPSRSTHTLLHPCALSPYIASDSVPTQQFIRFEELQGHLRIHADPSDRLLCRALLPRLFRDARPGTHPDPRRIPPIHPRRIASDRAAFMGNVPRSWWTDQHVHHLLPHRRALITLHLAPCEIVRGSHLIRNSTRCN